VGPPAGERVTHAPTTSPLEGATTARLPGSSVEIWLEGRGELRHERQAGLVEPGGRPETRPTRISFAKLESVPTRGGGARRPPARPRHCGATYYVGAQTTGARRRGAISPRGVPGPGLDSCWWASAGLSARACAANGQGWTDVMVAAQVGRTPHAALVRAHRQRREPRDPRDSLPDESRTRAEKRGRLPLPLRCGPTVSLAADLGP